MSESWVDNQTMKKCFKGIVSYMGYFASRYVGNDIQLLCGNILDHPVMKTFTLFCIMFQATDNIDLALMMTIGFLIIQYVMSISPMCSKYADKTNVRKKTKSSSTAWVHDKDLNLLNLKKNPKRSIK